MSELSLVDSPNYLVLAPGQGSLVLVEPGAGAPIVLNADPGPSLVALAAPGGVLTMPAAQGPAGAARGSTVQFTQSEPSTLWTIYHGLERYPSPVFFDTAGDLLLVDFSYPDANTLIAKFTAPTSGVAYLN